MRTFAGSPTGRRHLIVALCVVVALTVFLAGPAAAEPPERSDAVVVVVAPDFAAFPAPENGRAGSAYSTKNGSRWRYAWHWRLLIDKNDAFGVTTASVLLHPLGG
ncbi:hypothetical protein ACL02O_20560 [Micromonospora sp. MS34]|uniref:hypothetical protein n=1 Tax=Micromonospora sp. MS34 TaxID=3385971 RepID=UPI00399F8DCB